MRLGAALALGRKRLAAPTEGKLGARIVAACQHRALNYAQLLALLQCDPDKLYIELNYLASVTKKLTYIETDPLTYRSK